MITAVDTNVLLDIFAADAEFGPRSKAVVHACLAEGRLVACDVVWTEIGATFPSSPVANEAMQRLGVEFGPAGPDTALAAADAWRAYRRRGGRRERLAADFLIGAHALLHADRLLTRDRGFYRAYFSRLEILDPTRT